MPICLTSYVAAIGQFYPIAIKISTQKLDFITPELIPCALALINYDPSTAFIVYFFSSSYFFSSNQFGSCRTKIQTSFLNHSKHLTNNPLSNFSTLYNSLFIILMLLSIANDIHPNPGPHPTPPQDRLSIIHINANHIKNKIYSIAYEASRYDIITVSETFLNEDSKEENLVIEGFHKPVRKDRDHDGGGVAIYVKKTLLCKHRRDLDIPDLEAVWVETNVNKERLLIGSFYRPPSKPISYWDLIDTSIKQASSEPLKLFVLGDFNSDYLHNPSNHLMNLIRFNNLKQVIDEPTRITQTTATCLDLILTSNVDLISECGVLPPICSDHSVPFVNILLSKPNHYSFKRTVYDYSNLNSNKCNEELARANLLDIVNTPNLDDAAQLFSDTVLNTSSKCMPVKTVIIRTRDAAWVNDDIRILCKNKNKAHKRAKSSNSCRAWAYYRSIRNEYTNAIRKRKQEYDKHIDDKISSAKNFNEKDWWKLVRSFMTQKGLNSDEIPPLVNDNIIYDTNEEKASVLNDFFINQSTVDGNDDEPPDIPFLNHHIEQLTITPQDVLTILNSLDPSKAAGPDFIHNKILKACSVSLSEPLSILFNRSLSECKFPTPWKTSHVTPIFKKGDKSNCTNYRPISLLSCVGKVLETIVQRHVLEYLTTYDLITHSQSGFLPSHSTVYQLLTLYDDICSALDKGIITQAIFFDISKAFDKVWHRGLLKKLQAIGIRGNILAWFKSYLIDRKQATVIKNCISNYQTVRAGVPQGSVLGPTLFLIYINDIVSNIESIIKLFADDTSLYLSLNDHILRTATLNSDLQRINTWAIIWKVTFNALKTELVNFTTKRNPTILPLQFNDTMLENKLTHKHLGITFQHNGRWDSHLVDLISKTRLLVSCLKSYKHRLTRKSLEIIYTSFILPHFDYGDILYDNCPLYYKDKLEDTNLDALRTIIGTVRGTSHSKIYTESGFSSLFERRKKHKCIMYFKILNGLTPTFLTNYLPPLASSLNPYHRRRLLERRPPFARTELYRNSFFPSATIFWNSLPPNIQACNSISQLKHYLSRNDSVCPPRVYIGDRKNQIIHCRLRIGMSDLNFDLLNRHLTTNPSCRCGYAVETARHFFLECPLYDSIRTNTLSLIPPHLFTINLILHGSNSLSINENSLIFSLVQKFIDLTKRF